MIYTLTSMLLIFVLAHRYLVGKFVPHVDFFLLGFFFYFLIPGIVYEYAIAAGSPGMEEWRGEAEDFYSASSIQFFMLVMAWLLFYVAGTFFRGVNAKGNYIKYKLPMKGLRCSQPLSISLFTIAALIILVLFLYVTTGINSLFKGYAAEYDQKILGGVSACAIILNSLYLYSKMKGTYYLKYFLLLSLLVTFSILLLSGSRMYVVIPVLCMLSIYLLKVRSIMKKIIFPAVVFALLVIFIFVGVWRLESTSFSDDALYVFLGEPVFTSYSFISFWKSNEFKLFELPLSFISGFINLIPSVISPNKASFMLSIEDMGYYFEAPFGATSVVVSLLSNFGIIGSLLFMFALGFLHENLYRKIGQSIFRLVAYVCLVSLLPFMFFRDPLAVYIKAAITTSIVLPYMLMGLDFIFRSRRLASGERND